MQLLLSSRSLFQCFHHRNLNLADGAVSDSGGFKITGAKKSICIGAVPAPETYANCEIFFSKIQLNEIDYQGQVKIKK